MLRDERGVYGGLAEGHEKDATKGLSYDELFRQDQREDPLWSGSTSRVHKALGLRDVGIHPGDDLLNFFANAPSDLSYSSYHRHTQLESLLHRKKQEPLWDPLEGIDRYWHESKGEAQQSGDFESRRLEDKKVPNEGCVRIVIPHLMQEGEQAAIGLAMSGLVVTGIVSPQAYEFGWRVGDVVTHINRIPVRSPDEFRQAIIGFSEKHRLKPGVPIIADVWRQPFRSVHHPPPGQVGSFPRTTAASPRQRSICGGPQEAPPQLGRGYVAARGPVFSTSNFDTHPAAPPLSAGVAMGGPGSEGRVAELARENMILKQQLAERWRHAKQQPSKATYC
jgi:hypothetical protein